MKTPKDTLCQMSANQMSPNLCDPRDFEVLEAGEASKLSEPFHGQCGGSKAEYDALLREGEARANASDFAGEGEVHPQVNDAGHPHTPGMSGDDAE